LEIDRANGGIAWLSALTIVLAFANMLFYVSFVDYQPQARYVFVALAPAFLLLVLGLRNLTSRPAMNRALVFGLLVLLCLLQLASIQPLLERWSAMSAGL
jgi:hypothetical protein